MTSSSAENDNKPNVPKEAAGIEAQYARRREKLDGSLYSPLKPDVIMMQQEKERELVKLFHRAEMTPLENKRLLEIGCGSGTNIQLLLRLGFRPENIVGNELLAERVEVARRMLPEAIRILAGDAVNLDLPEASFDIVSQSTVFSSILDKSFQEKLAARLWSLVKPGGGILWYDFIYNNPSNPDVRGVPVNRIRELFPQGELHVWRVTLAPPLSRFVTRIHPALYTLFNAVPLLRTHVLCWVRK